MLKRLELRNVGPAPALDIEFGKRLNLLTGDNGLGKSFLLDVGWWAMTRRWPAEVNPGIATGMPVLPAGPGEASITFSFTGASTVENYTSRYRPEEQSWVGRRGRPANPGLVLYAMSDGAFAVWDPARNYWRNRRGWQVFAKEDEPVAERPSAYVFSPLEVWNGREERGTWLCNGLIRDWAGWQKENGAAFRRLAELLVALTPPGGSPLAPGPLTRISIDDQRDMPTIRMPYLADVPVVHASSAVRRIVALVYFLVWAWEEHRRAARLLQVEETDQIVLFIDEIEAHLHPSWQRTIVRALTSAMATLSEERATVQLVATTHSPLIMAAVEPMFDPATDAWFDLDLKDTTVELCRRPFERHGNADAWLTSEAFDLRSSRAPDYEELVEQAARLLEEDDPNLETVHEMNRSLVASLDPLADEFLIRWQHICRRKGWIE